MPLTAAARWGLAAVALATAAYHVAHRARRVRGGGLDVDAAHAAMGVAMAVMLTAGLDQATARWLAGGFAFCAGWFVARAARAHLFADRPTAGYLARQSLSGALMVGMLVLPSARVRAMAGMGMPGTPLWRAAVCGLVAAGTLLACWTARDLLTPPEVGGGVDPRRTRQTPLPSGIRHARPEVRPALQASSQLAGAVTATCMLALML
jgi:hypothetical protein